MSNLKKKMKMEDRISLLPNSLLHQILSSLNTKQVVQTCVLSKRWKTLWTLIPTLNFASDWIEKSFQHFVFRVLSEHRSEHIQKLSYKGEGLLLLQSLICYARCGNVRELCIDTEGKRFKKWKHCLSACSSLVVLKMSCGFVADWGALSLPSLEILEIHCKWECDLYFSNQKQGIKMFSGCPNLKSLVLLNYNFDAPSICAPKLENLELYISDHWILSPEVELLTPNLRSVKLSNVLPTIKSAGSEFSRIHRVDIEVELEFDGYASEKQKWAENFYELLRVFRNARCFLLPLEQLQVESSLSCLSGVTFHNLKHLNFKTNIPNKVMVIDLPVSILSYLQKCPHLETLAVLNEAEYRTFSGLEFWVY